MISSVVSVPHKYHQLFLLNLGFMIAIAKGFSTISACLALLFIVLLATVVNNRLLPLICSNCHLSNKLFEDVLTEAEAVKSKVVTYLLHLQNECNNNQKIEMISKIALLLYLSQNFLCPCVQLILIINTIFMSIYLPEELLTITSFGSQSICGVCSQIPRYHDPV